MIFGRQMKDVINKILNKNIILKAISIGMISNQLQNDLKFKSFAK